jgi:hypothetical protein
VGASGMIEIAVGAFVILVSYLIFCFYQYYKYGDPDDDGRHDYPYTLERHFAGFLLYVTTILAIVFGLFVAAYCIGTVVLAVAEVVV